ncbi:hypothetical protein [Williamsia sp. M5A3_1d]
MIETHTYTADVEATRRRQTAYDSYMASSVLTREHEFVCRSQAACRTQARNASEVGFFHPAQLGFIGDRFDLAIDGTPFRILCVGMDLGGSSDPPSLIDRATRAAGHDRARDPEVRGHHPHMRGIVLALRYLLGLGVMSDAEDIAVNGDVAHLLECYAAVNARLCSATTTERGRTSIGTTGMTHNCFPHLSATIAILQPHVVIVQGAKIRDDLQRVVGGSTELQIDKASLVRASIDGHQTSVAYLTHPLGRHDDRMGAWNEAADPYVHEVLRPILRRAVEVVRFGR